MRNSFLLLSLLSALVSGSSILVSCEGKQMREVTFSEVVDTGISQDVTVKRLATENGPEATELSYKTWIKVDSQTRAAHSDVYSVLLKDVFHNTSATIDISDRNFDIGEYTTETSYYVKDTRRDGYVTITDSVMVYTVNFAEFSFAYELEYEVAVYDDGISRETMPYHSITNLKDNGMKITPIENTLPYAESMVFSARRQIDHSISVDFCGETYTLKAKVILQVPFDDASGLYVKKSELLDSYYQTEGGQVISTLKLKRYWSDGQVKTEAVSAPVNVNLDSYFHTFTYDNHLPENIALVSYGLSDVYESYPPMYLFQYVTCGRDFRTFNINYGFQEFGLEAYYDTPFYYDGYLKCDFPVPTFKNFRFTEEEITHAQSGESEGRKYTRYWLTRYLKVDFDKLELEAPITIGLVVFE